MGVKLSDSEEREFWEENKSWFRRHWILTIILVLLVIGAIGAIFEDSPSIKGNVVSETQKYTTEDLYTIYTLFVDRNSPYTDLQKEEKWKEYDNKWIKDSGIVREIDEAFNPYVKILNPDNEFTTLATIYFKESEKEKLLDIGKYEEINFEGRLEQYNSLMGIIIKDAELV